MAVAMAVAVKLTTAPLDEVASTVNALGRCNVGGVVSRTSTLKLRLAVTWNELVAEQVTVCAARLSGETENVVPDAGVQVGVIGPSIGSVAVAVYETAVGGRAVTMTAALVVDSVVGNSV